MVCFVMIAVDTTTAEKRTSIMDRDDLITDRVIFTHFVLEDVALTSSADGRAGDVECMDGEAAVECSVGVIDGPMLRFRLYS